MATPSTPKSERISKVPNEILQVPKRNKWTDEKMQKLNMPELNDFIANANKQRIRSEKLERAWTETEKIGPGEDVQAELIRIVHDRMLSVSKEAYINAEANKFLIGAAKEHDLKSSDIAELTVHRKRCLETAENAEKYGELIQTKRRKVEVIEDNKRQKEALTKLASECTAFQTLKARGEIEEREPNAQALFRTKSLNYYDAGASATSEPVLNSVWCPIFRQYFRPDDVTSAHIVAYGGNQEIAAYNLGAPNTSFIMTPQNCLLMHTDLEQAWDRGIFVIAPKTGTEGDAIPVWCLKVIDLEKMNENVNGLLASVHLEHFPKNPKWRDLHNTELAFLNDNRPKKRYLFYKYLLNMICVYKRREIADLRAASNAINPNIWISPDKCIRTASLMAMSELVGHKFDQSSGFKDGAPEDDFPHPPSPKGKKEAAAEHAVKMAEVKQEVTESFWDAEDTYNSGKKKGKGRKK